MTTNCISCKNSYEEPQDEAYLCAPCLVEKKKLAAEIDAKHPPQPTPEYNKMSVEERFAPWSLKNLGRK